MQRETKQLTMITRRSETFIQASSITSTAGFRCSCTQRVQAKLANWKTGKLIFFLSTASKGTLTTTTHRNGSKQVGNAPSTKQRRTIHRGVPLLTLQANLATRAPTINRNERTRGMRRWQIKVRQPNENSSEHEIWRDLPPGPTQRPTCSEPRWWHSEVQ